MSFKLNLELDSGTTFESDYIYLNDFNGNPIDISQYTLSGVIYKDPFVTTTTPLTVTLVDDPTAKITLNLTATATAALKTGRYYYKVQGTTSGGIVTRFLEGQIYVNPYFER